MYAFVHTFLLSLSLALNIIYIMSKCENIIFQTMETQTACVYIKWVSTEIRSECRDSIAFHKWFKFSKKTKTQLNGVYIGGGSRGNNSQSQWPQTSDEQMELQ